MLHCSNLIIRNETDIKKLTNECGYSVQRHKWPTPSKTFFVESSTHALIFTNEKVVAHSLLSGDWPLNDGKGDNICLFIAKTSVRELSCGNKTLIMNIKIDSKERQLTIGQPAFHVTNFDLNVLNLTFPKVDKKLNLTEITSSVHQSFAHKLNLFTSSVHEVAQYAQQQYAHKLNLFTHLSSVFGAFILSIIIGAALYFFCKMKSRCFPERAGKAV